MDTSRLKDTISISCIPDNCPNLTILKFEEGPLLHQQDQLVSEQDPRVANGTKILAQIKGM